MAENRHRTTALEALSIPESAALAGVSRAFLYRLLSEGRGPRIIKIGARTLVRRQALADWLAQLEAETPQPVRGAPKP